MSSLNRHKLDITESLELLKRMISTSSFSREETGICNLLIKHLTDKGVKNIQRHKNNFWVYHKNFTPNKETYFFISHTDTVKPNSDYSQNPFLPIEKDGKLFGLGSNDAGGCAVTMIDVFLDFYEKNLNFNLALLLCGEEEISGENGIQTALKQIPEFSACIVGEPTEMKVAITERRLLVVDAKIKGKSGHVAWENHINPIVLAAQFIQKLEQITWTEKSEYGIKTQIKVTQIFSGEQHNVVPNECTLVLDIRMNEHYTPLMILQNLKKKFPEVEFLPRKIRKGFPIAPPNHPIVMAAKKSGFSFFGSNTSSDMSLIPYPSLKIGPGKSLRSHTADEYIFLEELKQGIIGYHQIIENLNSILK